MLNVFSRLGKIAEECDIKYFCIMQRSDGEAHFSGSDDLVKAFKDNTPLLQFSEDMIETRRTSLLQKINLSKSKKDAVCPSPSKGLSQMDFLPGLGSSQRQNLQNTTPEGEDSIALSRENILNI